MNSISLAGLIAGSLLIVIVCTGLLIPLLKRLALIDKPNERSSHISPTPFGGGLAVLVVIIVGCITIDLDPFGGAIQPITSSILWLIAGTVVLGSISWIDDLRGVRQIYRLCAHFLVILALLGQLSPDPVQVFQYMLPHWLALGLTALLWVWFVNLFNFMDGIDGISCIETIGISSGIALLSAYLDWQISAWPYAGILIGAALGFLWWNWQPAKVFLGDVGSVPLGFILGWILLHLAADGFWLQALILPFYYLADATFTLLARILRGENFWAPHKQHYYQQAIVKGYSHARVSTALAIGNLVLIGLAMTSLHAPVSGLVGASAVVFILLLYFKRKP
jgi:UDP-N-acetylmuramyl pentapeptide phosphotransferase/UDP-N-acetylglucosamine-1-phosphate transferase